MRFGLRDFESIAPVPFVLLAGMIGGVLMGVAEFVQRTTAGALAVVLVVGAATVLLWWLSVRRRQHNAWSAAFQITCVIGLAQLIALAFVIPRAVPATVHLEWRDVAINSLTPQLALSPIRFVEAAVLVAVGRLLPGSGRGGPLRAAASEQLDPVT